MSQITHQEYEKAYEIVERYKYQCNPTIQVSMEYNATIFVTIDVPANLTPEEIKERFRYNYYYSNERSGYSLEKKNTELVSLKKLIVNGIEIKL